MRGAKAAAGKQGIAALVVDATCEGAAAHGVGITPALAAYGPGGAQLVFHRPGLEPSPLLVGDFTEDRLQGLLAAVRAAATTAPGGAVR